MGKITRDAETQMIDKLIQVLAKLLTSHFYLNGNAREYKLLILGRFSNNARHMRTRKRAERRNGRDFRYLICLSAIGRGFEIWAPHRSLLPTTTATSLKVP